MAEEDEVADDASWMDCDRVYTNEKAGMAAVDKHRVKKTIYELSKNSEHFKNEERKQKQLEQRILKLRSLEATLTNDQLIRLTKYQLVEVYRETDERLSQLEEERDLTQTWLHVDMDAFFAAVEELHDPSLKGRPMAVGGKAMISTANYEARKYGVRSAMPGFIALQLCPQLIFVPNDFAKYRAASDRVRHVFRNFDPEFESASLDEAYLNITDYIIHIGQSPSEVATRLREQVQMETGLTCSVGIAPNCMLAKVASDMKKPNGQFEIHPDRDAIMSFLKTLPVRKVSGIGRVSEQTLKAFGIETCSDLIEERGRIAALFSKSSLEFFLAVGMGIGRTIRHEPLASGEIGRKGMSCERTFRQTSSQSELHQKLEQVSEELARHLKQESLRGKTLTLKLKSQTFEIHTRAITLGFFISTSKELTIQARPLLELEMDNAPFRLMGIRLSNFDNGKGTRQSMITDFMQSPLPPSVPLTCGHPIPETTG